MKINDSTRERAWIHVHPVDGKSTSLVHEETIKILSTLLHVEDIPRAAV